MRKQPANGSSTLTVHWKHLDEWLRQRVQHLIQERLAGDTGLLNHGALPAVVTKRHLKG